MIYLHRRKPTRQFLFIYINKKGKLTIKVCVMAIHFQTNGTLMPNIKRRKVSEWIKKIASKYGKKCGDITYIFCSDEVILDINQKYLNHDYYTDIITFDYSEDDVISGDMFISIDTVKSNSEELKTNYGEELHRVIIHGVLHLCGIEDKGEGARANMERAENEALAIW